MGRPKKITPTVEKAPARLPGTFDLLPEHHGTWDYFLGIFNSLAHTFGYSKIETPIIEDAKLFKFWEETSGYGLVSWTDSKGSRIGLRPTNLFSLARVYLDYHFYEREKYSKWFYVSPVVFAKDGAAMQAYEYGFQTFGEVSPIADAQLINLAIKLFSEAGLKNLNLEVNNIGCLECLPPYQEVLRNFFKEKKYDLCENCLEDLDASPVNILACNILSCSTVVSEAPGLIDYLCENCRKHFIKVLEGLDELSLPYNLNPKVIGKPWSRKTIFEIRYSAENQDMVLGSGGHADDLVQSLGGLPCSTMGFVGNLESIISALEGAQIKPAVKNKTEVFLVPLGDLAAKKTLRLFSDLWSHNIVAAEFIGPGSIKTQLKLAESNKVSIALIIGQKEARDGTVILRDVMSGMQELFTLERIIEEVKKRLGK